MHGISYIILSISIAIIFGIGFGKLKIKGVGLGVGGVLFSGLAVGHFLSIFNINLSYEILSFIKQFGMILFIYAIGNQVGPNFFSSLKNNGLRLNLLASLAVFLGLVVTIIIAKTSNLSIPTILGLFSGAVTSTPSLGAAQQALMDLGASSKNIAEPSLSYAIAYPFAIAGIILSMQFIKIIFNVIISKEEEKFEIQNRIKGPALDGVTIKVSNENINNRTVEEVIKFYESSCVVTRIKKQDEEDFQVPNGQGIINVGDFVRIVGEEAAVKELIDKLGYKVDDENIPDNNKNIDIVKLVVTNTKILGRSIPGLRIGAANNVVVSRIHRSGIDFAPRGTFKLQFGDIVTLIGKKSDIDSVMRVFGNKQGALKETQIIPIFLAIAAGVLIGSIPIRIPYVSIPIKLGFAGGPLIAALIFSRIGNIKSLVWNMPVSANSFLKDLGISMFLAVVGIMSGGKFLDTLINGDGANWILLGLIITMVPICIVGIIAKIMDINYITICGLLAGSMTDSPALAFVSAVSDKVQAAAQAYATVYPIAMFLRILSPQVIVMLLWH